MKQSPQPKLSRKLSFQCIIERNMTLLQDEEVKTATKQVNEKPILRLLASLREEEALENLCSTYMKKNHGIFHANPVSPEDLLWEE
mmetsp:Transcript_16883/g.25791  ORF Transcript_16883/g.25791 Transcript_16883/m.25791 type:complete len:86 (+) Transcript_16883:45-302(+)